MMLDRKINSLLLKILVIGFFLAQSACTPSILLKSELKIDKTQPVEKQIRFENFVNKTLTLGEEIATDAHTIKVISFPNGVEVILKPNTRIKISSVILFIGDVIVRTTGKFFKRTRNYFEVKTELVIAGIEGTQFQVSVDRQGNVSVLVLEGVVKLTPTMPVWPWKLLERSQKAMIRGQQPPQIIPARPSEIDEINQFINRVDKVVGAAKTANAAFGAALGAAIAGVIGVVLTETLDKNKDGPD